jgi:hypothetical protein
VVEELEEAEVEDGWKEEEGREATLDAFRSSTYGEGGREGGREGGQGRSEANYIRRHSP